MTSEALKSWFETPASQQRPLVMGVLNVTPDSFSDGGRFADVEAAVAHAQQLVQDGVDIIDIGGESTRPGAQRVDSDEQSRRIVPVIERLAANHVAISVDTTRATVAERALQAGACLVNDVSGGTEDPEILALVARHHASIALMHMQGEPATMQNNPSYGDVEREVTDYLRQRYNAAVQAGVAGNRILLDPGIGFGKTFAHNVTLLRSLTSMQEALPGPLLLGVSRKRFIGEILEQADASKRVHGSVAAAIWCAANGARVVRVHDVAETVQALKVWIALMGDAS